MGFKIIAWRSNYVYTLERRNPYLSISISKPRNGEIAGEHFTYMANDCSVGDLDGVDDYEIILKWSLSKRPPQRGFTGNTYLYAYKIGWDKVVAY